MIQRFIFRFDFKVYLVHHREDFYAMKSLRKNLILEGQSLSYIRSERDILVQSQSNPFIVQLLHAFQNVERLFFLMEVARAGTLYDLLEFQAPKPFKQEQIIFYIGQVTSALLFLHSKNIVRSFSLLFVMIWQISLSFRFIEI